MGQVKVILREDIPKLGDAGDVVAVRPGYARNFLIPKGIAIPATTEKVKEVEHYRRMIEKRQIELLKDLKGASKAIREMDLEFEAQAGDSGKLIPRRISGNCAKHQRPLALAVKRARQVALLPYSTSHI